MKNIWILLVKYNAFFLFILFFSVSFLLIIQNNHFQRSTSFNSSHRIVGHIYAASSNWTDYLSLRETNKQLAAENALLHGRLSHDDADNLLVDSIVTDTIHASQYRFIAAKVTNNSINQKNNYITVNKGSNDGVKKGMGVISPSGVVGIVLNVSPHFATIQSLLHRDTRISALLVNSQAFGSLIWGEHIQPRKGVLRDIPNHVEVTTGEKVVTSGYSLFPPGIPIGKVTDTKLTGGESFLDIDIALSTDFYNLQYVYIVMDRWESEKKELEAEQ